VTGPRASKLTGHRDLRVWQDAMTLVRTIYIVTRDFPKDEQYGLSSQLRRAVVSVPSNIAEGAARTSKRESAQFLSVARGSLAEVETQILIAKDLGYLTEEEGMLASVSALLRSISALMKSPEK
jgi:four helix bundle protein